MALIELVSAVPHSPLSILLVASGLFLAWNIHSLWRLRHIPGPFAAALTNFPRLKWVLNSNAHDTHIALHRKYGSLVRFGPNMVSISDPQEIPNIYGTTGKYQKSDFYWVLSFYVKGKAIPGLFATQDEHIHRLLKKPISAMYSMSSVVNYEPFVDSTMNAFFKQIDQRFAEPQKDCAFDLWLQMFAHVPSPSPSSTRFLYTC